MRGTHSIRQKPQPPSRNRLEEMLGQSGIRLNKEQLDQLWRYHNLIRSRNQDRDLTRITEFGAMVTKHYVDCLIIGKFVTLPSPLLDVGTGAGFPGIPLKIRYPHLKIWLAEPRPRRVAFLQDVVRQLGLKNAWVFEHKVVSRSFREPVQGVITRALETMDKTLLRTSACVVKGGLVLFMKGPGAEPEVKDVAKRFGDTYRLVLDETYRLPHTSFDRRLLGYERLVSPEKPQNTEESDAENPVL